MSDGDRWWKAVKATVTPLAQAGKQRSRNRYTKVAPGILDLHGMTVQQAYDATLEFIEHSNGPVIVITGKSGQIYQEFSFWLENQNRVKRSAENKGGGSFQITLGNPKKDHSK